MTPALTGSVSRSVPRADGGRRQQQPARRPRAVTGRDGELERKRVRGAECRSGRSREESVSRMSARRGGGFCCRWLRLAGSAVDGTAGAGWGGVGESQWAGRGAQRVRAPGARRGCPRFPRQPASQPAGRARQAGRQGRRPPAPPRPARGSAAVGSDLHDPSVRPSTPRAAPPPPRFRFPLAHGWWALGLAWAWQRRGTASFLSFFLSLVSFFPWPAGRAPAPLDRLPLASRNATKLRGNGKGRTETQRLPASIPSLLRRQLTIGTATSCHWLPAGLDGCCRHHLRCSNDQHRGLTVTGNITCGLACRHEIW